MKDHASIFSPKPTNPVEVLTNEMSQMNPKIHNLKEQSLQNPRSLKKIKKKNLLNEIKKEELKENKVMSEAQENTNKKLMEIMDTFQNLITEFNQEIEALKRI